MSAEKLLLITILSASPSLLDASVDDDFKIIVNSESQVVELDGDELKRIYLGKLSFWESGPRIVPSLTSEKSQETKSFLEGRIRKTVRQYRAYWTRRIFSGGGTAPRAFRTSAQVIDFVASNPGGIGVVAAGVDDGRVKVVAVKN